MRFTQYISSALCVILTGLIFIPFNSDGDNTFLLFLGRFHPLILHIPVGALLALFVLEFFDWLLPDLKLGAACQILLWISALTSVWAVFAGILLASSGGYSDVVLDRHKWLGFATAFLCVWLLFLRPWLLLQKAEKFWIYRALIFTNIILLSLAGHYGGSLTHGSDYLTKYMPVPMKSILGIELSESEKLLAEVKSKAGEGIPEAAIVFAEDVQPLMDKYCYECHNMAKQKGDIRLDDLGWDLVNTEDGESWHSALDMINTGDMPPEDEKQMSDKERRLVVGWITDSLEHAKNTRKGNQSGVMRRLTKAQYTNTLNNLLTLPVNFGEALPDDGKSKMGFSNNGSVLQISPLHIDYYKQIAREALNKAIVFGEKPEPKRFKVTLGQDIGRGKMSAEFGGFQTVPIDSNHIEVDLAGQQQAKLNKVKQQVGIGMRGSTNGRYGMTDSGMLLYSALPHRYVPPRSWQGPSPNMKMIIKNHFPQEGGFLFRVEAARGKPLAATTGLINLRNKVPAKPTEESIIIRTGDAEGTKNINLRDNKWLMPNEVPELSRVDFKLKIPKTGYYQMDLVHPYASRDAMPAYRLTFAKIGRSEERLKLDESLKDKDEIVTAMTLAYFPKGEYDFSIGGKFFVGMNRVVVTPLPADNKIALRIAKEAEVNEKKFGTKTPSIRAYAGSRTDDGMDYAAFDEPQEVTGKLGEFKTYTFKGRLENLPIPIYDSTAVNVHANSMAIGVWNDYLVKKKGESGPPLVVRSMEIEAPHYEAWPPESHTSIFIDSPNKGEKETYTREVLENFMTHAFRRSVKPAEVDRYLAFWKEIEGEFDRYEDGVKEVLVSVLCSPNFLFIAEKEGQKTLKADSEYALASKLSYFLWNAPPDRELLDLATTGKLEENLSTQIDRMVNDPKVWNMIRAFSYEWLRVDRQQVMNTDIKLYADYSRFVKEDMPRETYHFIYHVLKENLSIMNFIDSDFAMLNQNLAEFYKIKGVEGSHFRPVSVKPEMHRGGLLSQGAFLNGHSDGVQGHPIKRAVWLKEKILADPPPPAPPNVPELDPDTPGFEKMTLKEQLELHRNKASCVDCHLQIDPYGVAFENFDAVGRYREEVKGKPVDALAELPDGTKVEGITGLKEYILTQKKDDVAYSVIEHLFAYALGRDVSFVDEDELHAMVEQVAVDGYRFQSVIKSIVMSSSFTNNHKEKTNEQKIVASR